VFVAADWFTGDPVKVRQSVQPAPAQYSVDGRGRQAELVTDPDRSEAFTAAQAHNSAYYARRGRVGLAVWARRPIVHAGGSVVAVPVSPAFRGRPGHLEQLGGLADGPAVVDHETRES
jgi:hypothetical protein